MKRNIIIAGIASAFVWMFTYTYTPIFPSYISGFGVSAAALGIISGSYGITQLILKLPLGLLMDRTNNDRLILCFGFFLALLSNLVFVLWGESIAALLLARSLAGAGASWWLVVSVLYAKYYPADQQAKAQGRLAGISNLGKIGGCALCAQLTQLYGHRIAFIAALIVSAVALCSSLGLQNIPRKELPRVSLRESKIFKNRDLIYFSILSIISQSSYFALVMTFNQIAAERLGASNFELGLLSMLAFAVCGLSAPFVGSRLYRRLGGKKTTALGFLLGAIGSAPFLLHANIAGLILAQSLGGACYGITQATLAGFVMQCVPKNQRGLATGVYQSLFSIGVFLGPVIAGIAADILSFDGAYWVIAATLIAALILSFVWITGKYSNAESV